MVSRIDIRWERREVERLLGEIRMRDKASLAHSSSDRNDMILNYEYVLDRISFPMRKYETM